MADKNLVVVMATFNGAQYLEEQLASILSGQLVPQKIIIRDDGSTDQTLEILQNYQQKYPDIIEYTSNTERLGVSQNFFALLQNLPDNTDYVALSDQDDIWQEDKLDIAMQMLSKFQHDMPSLYCSRQSLVDQQGSFIQNSPNYQLSPSFANAIVQNIVTGCTAVINRPLLDLVKTLPVPNVSYHDWWLYIMVTGVGGNILFDPQPTILYRQHGSNVVGSPVSVIQNIQARIKRIKTRSSKVILRNNLAAALEIRPLLTLQNQKTLSRFDRCLKQAFWKRSVCFFSCKIYRQTRMDSLILFFLIVSGQL